MKAVAIEAHGTLDQVKILDLPLPEPGPGQVRIRVHFAALNRLDLYTVHGIKGLVLKMPHILGSDAAGTIDQVGPGVTGWFPGDRATFNPGVWCGQCERCRAGEESECATYGIVGETQMGSMAEFAVVPAPNLYKLPASFPLEHAAAASLVFQTAYRMVAKAQVKAGDVVVVLGAGSGLSTALLQLAKLHGARIIATTSSPAKMEQARKLGADEVVNYKTEDWSKRVWELTGKRGADVVFDAIGKETLNASIRALRKGGRVVIPGGTSGQVVELDLRYVFWKQVQLLGSTMGNPREFRAAMDLVVQGAVRPVIGEIRPFAEARSAFETLERGLHFGKLLLRFA